MNKYKNYLLRPTISFDGNYKMVEGYNAIFKKTTGNMILETYPGVRKIELINAIRAFDSKINIIDTDDYSKYSAKDFRDSIMDDLTEDRVFGKFTRSSYEKYYDLKLIKDKLIELKLSKSRYVVIGLCAYLFKEIDDDLFYFDMPRWEIQLRYRNGEGVYFKGDNEKDKLKNFKRGYFIEWRMADKIKQHLWNEINYFVDTTKNNKPIMICAKEMRGLISQSSQRPFRLVPYFDAGVWGGDWMENQFLLGKNKHNKWAWGFDGVPEENSVIFELSKTKQQFELPSINIVLFEPKNLLGENVWSRFGSEFPIRFDFLDTMNGGNLSLQVHPLTNYIQENFNARYTQEESYYILDTDTSKETVCYLGVKNGFNKKVFIKALEKAQKTQIMDVDKFINKFPVKKHDHLIHPAGVIHSSGSGCMVLEISATPYIFTFKLWDWGRLGLDGKPRPINIKHGSQVIEEEFNTDVCKSELVSPFVILQDDENYREEKTGLHPRQFIETRRHTIKTSKGVEISTHESVNMLNLVEGEEVEIYSIDNSFPSLIVHYAETFIIPSSCIKFGIKATKKSFDQKIMVLQAFVRTKA